VELYSPIPRGSPGGKPKLTLEKAIAILISEIEYPGTFDIGDIEEAQRLGIEALKREKLAREHEVASFVELLPGETKE
jgi:hypothetical protein